MLKINKFVVLFGFSIFLAFAITACDQPEEEHEESQDDHVCEHLVDGPSADLNALSDMATAIDSLNMNDSYRVQAILHTRYDVALLADSLGGYYGWIAYQPVAGDGDYTLYMDKYIDVTIVNSEDSAVVTPESVIDHSDHCSSVAYKGIYHLHGEDTYYISMESDTESLVSMLIPKTEENEDDHDH